MQWVAGGIAVLVLSLSAQAATTTLVATGSVWKYLDNGSNPGTNWCSPSFDDSLWAAGPAELGYGDSGEVPPRPEATVVGYGLDPQNKYVTTYFRRPFVVDDSSLYTNLAIRLLRDDGAIVYLNGAEIFRSNMPQGPVTYTTWASTAVGGADETTYFQGNHSASALVSGTNMLAVEVHQANANSSDLSFDLSLVAVGPDVPPIIVTNTAVIRGPYLQSATTNSIIVRWRTREATDSRVRYDTNPNDLATLVNDAAFTTEHIVTLTNLLPATKYYYSVGTSDGPLVADTNFYFTTSPLIGSDVPTRIWVLGDPGYGGSGARSVRNAYTNFTGLRGTDLVLTLGDNEQNQGTDSQFQTNFFDVWATQLRSLDFWTALGNHETNTVSVPGPHPYFDIFSPPTDGRAGGTASGTKNYYSFEYGRIHCICLDSVESSRATNGPMANWLRSDLAATGQPWIIAYWHYPPYSKGGYDSDTVQGMIEMRANIVPMLEAGGVDLVLCGHTHVYERSYLINGHYGMSSTFVPSMQADGGDGHTNGTGAYLKPGNAGTNRGTVYVVASTSSQAGSGSLNHPAMFSSLGNVLGSCVIDVDGDRLDFKFLDSGGTVRDYFTVLKSAQMTRPAVPTNLIATAIATNQIRLTWANNPTNELGFKLDRSTDGANFAPIAFLGANLTNYTNVNLELATTYSYRLRAWNAAGDSDYANLATATTLVPPAITADQSISYTGSTYSENFDSMGVSGTQTPGGWFCGPGASGNGAIAQTGPLIIGNGSESIPGNWNVGPSGGYDRALGSHAASAVGGDLNMEVRLVNNTAQAISAFEVHYDGEQWRANQATEHPQRLEMRYSTDGIHFVAMGSTFWFAETQPNGTNALDGNLSSNRVANIGGVYTPASPVPVGTTIFLRWWDYNNVGWDQLLAIDNFTFRAVTGQTTSSPPSLVKAIRLRDLTNIVVTFSQAMSTNVTGAHGSVLNPSNYTVFQTMDANKTLNVYGYPTPFDGGSFSSDGQTTVRLATESPISRGYDPAASYTLMVSYVADLADNKIVDHSTIILSPQYGFQHGLDGYNYCQDTSLTPGTNLGWVVLGINNDSVWADLTDGLPPDQTQGLLRFDDLIGSDPAQISPGASVLSASLTLYSTRASEDSGSQVNMHIMLTNWNQNTATFYLFGPEGVQTNGIQAEARTNAVFLPNFPNPNGLNTQSRTVDVTSAIQAWVNGQPNYGWLFNGTSGDGYGFDSIKYPVTTNHPLLLVDFASALTLTAMPPTNHLYVTYGQSFTFAFGMSKGSAAFQWYKDGIALPGAGSSGVWVGAATLADAGTYYLRASNRSGATNSPSVTVTVTPDLTRQGKVYLVVGSDTAIWNAGTTVDVYTRHPHYKQDFFTDPTSASYKVMDPLWRNQFKDSYGQTLKFTWWMMGGNIYRDADNINVPVANTMTLHLMKQYHGEAIRQFGDELSLHYHTYLWSDYNGDGTYYWNQARTFNECREDFEVTLAQYLLEEEVYPVSFRSGWHFMDNDWQQYLNQLLPYSMHDNWPAYKAWSTSEPIDNVQDWSRAPSVFIPFHPSATNYQTLGNGKGWDLRSIKMQSMVQSDMNQIFAAASNGVDQVVCIWNHLPEDFVNNVARIDSLIRIAASNSAAVPYRYCTAVEGMQQWLGTTDASPPQLEVTEEVQGQAVTLSIRTSEAIFQPQPFVCVRDAFQQYRVLSCRDAGTNSWTVTLPWPRNSIAKVGIAVTDPAGNLTSRVIRYLPDDLYLDNLDSQYLEMQGNWVSTAGAAWGTNARIARLSSNDTARVRWSLPISRSGVYNLSLQVPSLNNAASNIWFNVYAGGSNVCSVFVRGPLPTNQWLDLAAPLLDQTLSNALEMTVNGSNQPNTYAVADVVRVSPLPDTNAPTITCSNLLMAGASPNGAPVTFAVSATDSGDPHPVVVCVPSSGAWFQPGTSTVACTAADASGNTNRCSFTVTIIVAPTITCASSRSVELGTAWDFLLPTATGSNVTVSAVSTVTNAGCGDTFSATRTWTATDAFGQQTACSQTITVVDLTPPIITCAPSKTVEYGLPWAFDTPMARDQIVFDALDTVTNADCGNTFSATRTWQATDECGNSATCSQTVRVIDSTPPTLICLPDRTVAVGAAWDFDTPTASDPAGNVRVMVLSTITNMACGQPWSARRTWEASDACGNQSRCSQTIVSDDTTPPFITTQPQNLLVVQGATATLSIAATGAPPLCFQWQRDGADLAGQTNASLLLTNVQPPDAGNYALRVYNAYGQVTGMVATLALYYPPVPPAPPLERFIFSGVKMRRANLRGSYADGETWGLYSASPTSAYGGTVATNAAWIFYSPPAGFTNADSFTYTVSDSRGTLGSGIVTINVKTDTDASPNHTVQDLGDGRFRVRFAGIPARTYTIQVSNSLEHPGWGTVATATANALGAFEFVDTLPDGSGPRYYRSTQP